MGRLVRSCLQSLLKIVNSVIGFVGLGMVLYSLWMIRVWYKHTGSFWDNSSPPWFIYTFLGLGVTLCLATCSGHIAAETANGCCLSCYMVFVFLLVMLEAAVTADIFLNRQWEEDFPEDETGKLDELKRFIKSNFEMCKWIGLGIVGAQAMSIFLAMVLRAFGSNRSSFYDSDEEYATTRLPLLRDHMQHPPYVVDPRIAIHNNSWNTRANEKVSRV